MPRVERPAPCRLLRTRGWRLLAAALGLGPLLGVPPARAAGPGEILGQAFTADNPDSTAGGAAVTLVYRDAGGAVRHQDATAGADGSFDFTGLPADTAIAFVIKVDYRGLNFLGSPVHFAPGQPHLEFNVLVSARPEPSNQELPAGHPPVEAEAPPPPGRPVPDRPGVTVLLTMGVAALFGIPVYLLARKDRRNEPEESGAR